MILFHKKLNQRNELGCKGVPEDECISIIRLSLKPRGIFPPFDRGRLNVERDQTNSVCEDFVLD